MHGNLDGIWNKEVQHKSHINYSELAFYLVLFGLVWIWFGRRSYSNRHIYISKVNLHLRASQELREHSLERCLPRFILLLYKLDVISFPLWNIFSDRYQRNLWYRDFLPISSDPVNPSYEHQQGGEKFSNPVFSPSRVKLIYFSSTRRRKLAHSAI